MNSSGSHKAAIMFIDDEKQVLSGLRRSLDEKRNQWNMKFVESGSEALSLLECEHYDIVVTDLKMPVIDGMKLLEIVKEKHPSVIRFLLSAHVRRPFIFDTLAVAHHVLLKPCRSGVLESIILRWLDIRNHVPAGGRMLSAVFGLNSIPVMPTTRECLMRIKNLKTIDLPSVADLFEDDTAFALECFRMAGGTVQESGRVFRGIDEAVSCLGHEGMERLVDPERIKVMSSDMIKILDMEKIRERHALVGSGIIARISVGVDDPLLCQEAKTAALLHDVGRIILFLADPVEYERILLDSNGGSRSLCELEKNSFGMTHADAGGHILAMCGLSSEITEAVRLHHTVLSAGEKESGIRAALYQINAEINGGADD